jgi:uncharacterized C2H2 Zn-finger protein
MFEKFAGLYTQIQNLKKKLKKLDTSKHNEKQVKEIVEALNILEERYDKEKAKREERLKAKEQAAQEVEKEAINIPSATEVGAVSQNTPAPAATPGAPASTPDDQKVSCPLCGGMTFNDNASYQQHMAYTHASDIMPTNPGQKQDNLVASTETEAANKCAICGTQFNSFEEYQAHQAESHSKTPALTSKQDKEAKFDLDAVVEPVRGAPGSKGRVMRHDSPKDLAYVMWESGPLKDRDGFGGYYSHDLKSAQQEKPIEAAPVEAPACEDCTGVRKIHSDLKSNYEGLLKDLKEERDIHYTQGNSKWVSRLDQKIRDLEKAMEEKFPAQKESSFYSTSPETWHKTQHEETGNKDPKCELCNKPADKKAGAQNDQEHLTVMDHTPPRANSGPDAGGKDTHDEFQDEWAMPAGIELQSKLPKKQQKELDAMVQQAVYGYQINIMDMNKVYQAGEAAFISGQDVIAAVHAFLDSMVAAGKAMKTAAVKAPVTQPTKLLVFKREFLATPLKEQEKFGGYEISQNGKKLFKINSKDSQPMSKEQIEFCAQIELTRGLKQAKLTEKVAFLAAGTKVYILAQDKPGKRIKFASMEHGIRGWAPVSKFAFLAKEGEMRKHKDHIDNTYGHNGKEMLVDCPNGSGNMVWLPINELLSIQAPPATPESLNPDLGTESSKKCRWCGKPSLPKGQFCKECQDALDQQTKSSARQSFQPGTKARISSGSGVDSDKIVTIVDRSLVKTDGRGIPTNVSGAYKPVDWNREVAFQYEDGTIGTMFKNRLMPVEQTLESKVVCPKCKGVGIPGHGSCPECGGYATEMKERKESAKDCPDCHGNFTGAEGATCPTCGRFAVQKEALRPALPPQILNRRQEVNAADDNAARCPACDGVGAAMGKLGTKEEAVKRLRQVEFYKNASVRPFSKKADVLTDHITEVKNNIDQVQQRLQEVPAIKTADTTTEVTEEETSTGNSLTPIPGVAPLPTVPTINNVQPTDNDNLEIPVPMPTSPPAPGQKWVYNDVDGVYVSMPDTTDPSKLV